MSAGLVFAEKCVCVCVCVCVRHCPLPTRNFQSRVGEGHLSELYK